MIEERKGIDFGCSSPTITEQLKKQNFVLIKNDSIMDTKFLDEIKSSICSMRMMQIVEIKDIENIQKCVLDYIEKHRVYDMRNEEVCGNCSHFEYLKKDDEIGVCDIFGAKLSDVKCENDFEFKKETEYDPIKLTKVKDLSNKRTLWRSISQLHGGWVYWTESGHGGSLVLDTMNETIDDLEEVKETIRIDMENINK